MTRYVGIKIHKNALKAQDFATQYQYKLGFELLQSVNPKRNGVDSYNIRGIVRRENILCPMFFVCWSEISREGAVLEQK